jgi:hypothetical protein
MNTLFGNKKSLEQQNSFQQLKEALVPLIYSVKSPFVAELLSE